MPTKDEPEDKGKEAEDIDIDLDALPSIDEDKGAGGGEPSVEDITPEDKDRDKLFNVFLSRPGDLEKYDIATDLLQQILGIDEEAAVNLIEKPLVTIAKAIEKDQADKIVGMFKARGVLAKATVVKK